MAVVTRWPYTITKVAVSLHVRFTKYLINTSYMLSFRHDAILPVNGCNTVFFINLTVKVCLKVNLHILATRLVGASLTFLNIFLLFHRR